MYQKLLEEWKQTKEGKMYFEQAGVFARLSVQDFVKWLDQQDAQQSVQRTGDTHCPNCDTKWEFHDPRVCAVRPPAKA